MNTNLKSKIYNADIYLRLSKEDGDKEESDSITNQRELILAFLKSHEDIRIHAIRVDDGYSGVSFKRPAFQQMLEDIKNGEVNCVVTKDISRFGRDYLMVGDYLEQIFPFMGVRFIADNDGYDSNDYIGTTGGLEVAFRSLMYDMYSKDLSVKMRSALEVRRKRGDIIGPRPPFGYQFSEDKKALDVDEVAAVYVKRIFQLACEGYSTGKIAIKLNEEKIPTPGQYKNQRRNEYHIMDGEGFWDRNKVLKILENRVYLGTVVNAKYKVTEIGVSHFRRVPDEERIYVADRHEAVVTEEIFNRASQVIKNRGCQKGKTHHYGKSAALLGKIKCRSCGKSMVRISCTKIPCYACERVNYDKNSRCFQGQLKEPEAEAYVLGQINQKLENLEAERGKQELELPKDRIQDVKREIAVSEDRIKTLKAGKQCLYEQFKLGRLDRAAYSGKIERLREEEAKMRECIEQAKKKKAEIEEQQKNQAQDSGRGKLMCLSREVVEKYIDTIYVCKNGQLDIKWK